MNAHTSPEAQSIDVVLNSVVLSQQSVDVKGIADNPVTDNSGTHQDLPTKQAKLSPTRPVTLTDALPLIPGIIRAQDGSVKIAGLGEDHSALLVNSVDVTDPATGGFGLSVPIDSVQTVEVSVMPYLAQYGNSPPAWLPPRRGAVAINGNTASTIRFPTGASAAAIWTA